METKLRQQIEKIITNELLEQINDGCKPFNGITISDFIANNNEQINKVISELLKLYKEEINENNNYEFTDDQIEDELNNYIETTDWNELNRILFERECNVIDKFENEFYKNINNKKK